MDKASKKPIAIEHSLHIAEDIGDKSEIGNNQNGFKCNKHN